MKMKSAVNWKKCHSCGCKFFGKTAENHVAGSEDCLEWYRDRMENQFSRALD